MKDALGSVQSVLVLGGGSEIALATVRGARRTGARRPSCSRRGGRRSSSRRVKELRDLAGAAPGRDDRGGPVRRRPPSTDHDAFVDGRVRPVRRLRPRAARVRRARRPGQAERDGAAAVEIARVNYLGAVSVPCPVANRLRAQGHGTIVVLSSVAGERARKSNFVYGSTKAGLDAFFQGLGDALVGTGVSVMIVRPGFVHTKMTEGLSRRRSQPRRRPSPTRSSAASSAAARSSGCRPRCGG